MRSRPRSRLLAGLLGAALGWASLGVGPAHARVQLIGGACTQMQLAYDGLGHFVTTGAGLCQKAGATLEFTPVLGTMSGSLAGNCDGTMSGYANLSVGQSGFPNLAITLASTTASTGVVSLFQGLSFVGYGTFTRSGCSWTVTFAFEDPAGLPPS